MEGKRARKHGHLKKTGFFHPAPELVNDPLFRQHPEFFDAHDSLQVRYEMIRSHRIDQQSVVEVCQRYGVSRQTFYTLQERFVSEGTPGLFFRKPGPKAPSKLTAEVLECVEKQLDHEPELRAVQLQSQLERTLGVHFHRRTLEKLLKELRPKKTLEPARAGSVRRSVDHDLVGVRYESLRTAFLQTGCTGNGELWDCFSLFGMSGLVRLQVSSGNHDVYIVEVYPAATPRWYGRRDPREEALKDVLRL